MKLRTKIILFSILIAVITIVPLFSYVVYLSRTTFITDQKNNTENMVNVIYNAIEGQYNNSVNQQIIDIFNIKKSLKETATIFSFFQQYQISHNSSEAELYHFLKLNQEAYSKDNFYLITLYQNKFIGSKESLELLKAKTLNKENLEDLILGEIPYTGTFDIAKINNHSYLTYIFSPNYQKNNFNFAILKNIDHLVSSYDQIYQEMHMFVKELYDSLPIEKVTPLYLLDENFDVILTNNFNITPSNPFKYKPDSLKQIFSEMAEANNAESPESNSSNQKVCSTYKSDFICYSYFKPLKIYVMTLQSMKDLEAYGDKILIGMATIGATVLFLMILISISYVTRITKSLNSIAKTAREIADADLSDENILNNINFRPHSSNDEVGNLSDAIANMSNSLKSNINKLVESTAKQNKIKGELGVAFDIQMGMLPNRDNIPKSNYYQIAAFIHPAKEVGGDFYDVFKLDENHLIVSVGDVSDKGVPAAMFMSICVTLMRQIFKTQNDISKSMEILNSCLSERNPNLMFVTIFVMIINTQTGEFTYVNAGHCKPLIIHRDSYEELSETSGPALGIMSEATYSQSHGKLEPDDYIMIYTDGISEAQDENGKFFESDRIYSTIDDRKFNSANSLVYALWDNVTDFRKDAAQSDDMTILCYQRKTKDGDKS